jgi:hypothetical protein
MAGSWWVVDVALSATRSGLPIHLPAPCPAEESEEDGSEENGEEGGDENVQRWIEDSSKSESNKDDSDSD